MKAIYKFHFNCGRMGTLDGIFTANQAAMNALITSGKKVYFGEVLGKHSEIRGPVEAEDITMVSANPDHVQMFEELNLATGYNPFDNLEEDEAQDSEEGAE